MTESEDKRLKYEIEYFNSALIPFGYLDVKAAVGTALDGGHDGDWVAEQIKQFIDDTEIKLDNIDPNYVVYDSLLQEARNDIEQLMDKDILNDTKEQIDVYGNFMCTSLDYSEEAKEELIEILKEIDPDDETNAIKWLISEVDIRSEIDEAKKNSDEEEEIEEDEGDK